MNIPFPDLDELNRLVPVVEAAIAKDGSFSRAIRNAVDDEAAASTRIAEIEPQIGEITARLAADDALRTAAPDMCLTASARKTNEGSLGALQAERAMLFERREKAGAARAALTANRVVADSDLLAASEPFVDAFRRFKRVLGDSVRREFTQLSVVDWAPRWSAIGTALGHMGLVAMVNTMAIPTPDGGTHIVAAGRYWGGDEPIDLRKSRPDDAALVAYCTRLAELAALERRVGAGVDGVKAKRAKEREAARLQDQQRRQDNPPRQSSIMELGSDPPRPAYADNIPERGIDHVPASSRRLLNEDGVAGAMSRGDGAHAQRRRVQRADLPVENIPDGVPGSGGPLFDPERAPSRDDAAQV